MAGAATEGEQLDEALSLAAGPRWRPDATRDCWGQFCYLRSLSYVDDRYDMNANYSLPRAPIVGGDVDFFPAALVTRGALTSFGFTGSYEYQLPVVKSRPFGRFSNCRQ